MLQPTRLHTIILRHFLNRFIGIKVYNIRVNPVLFCTKLKDICIQIADSQETIPENTIMYLCFGLIFHHDHKDMVQYTMLQ